MNLSESSLFRFWRSFCMGPWFWVVVAAIFILTRWGYFQEAKELDLLTLNQLRAMDMEKFLNWARILSDENRWLSDFDTSEETSPAAYFYNCFYQSPLYPYFMALVYKVTGVSTEFHGAGKTGYHMIIIFQQILGFILLWPLYGVSKRISGEMAARTLVIFFVLCDIMIFFETILLRAFLLSFLYLWLIHALLQLRDKPTLWRSVGVGIWMGLCWVCKPNFMAIAPLLFAWLWWARPQALASKDWCVRLGAVGLGLCFVLAFPVSRNLVLQEKAEVTLKAENKWKGYNPVPIFKMTTRGPYSYINGNSYHSYDDNHSIDYRLPVDFIAPGNGCGIGWDFNALKQQHYGAKFYSQDSAFTQKVLKDGRDDWYRQVGTVSGVMRLVWQEHSDFGSWMSRFWPMQFNKLKAFLNGYETPNNTNINVSRKFSYWMKFFFVDGTWILMAFLMGVVFAFKEWKKPEVVLILGFVLLFMSITIAFYFISRFRVPILPLMAIIGMYGIAKFVEALRLKRKGKGYMLLLLPVICLAIAWPRDVRGGTYQENYEKLKGIRYADYYNYALGKQEVNAPREALEITRVGVSQPGALVFSELIRIHLWALVRLPDRQAELIDFCYRLENYYEGRDPEKALRHPVRGLNSAMSQKSHAAIFSLALDQLLNVEKTDRQQRQHRIMRLKELYGRYGLVALAQERYRFTFDAGTAEPKHVQKSVGP